MRSARERLGVIVLLGLGCRGPGSTERSVPAVPVSAVPVAAVAPAHTSERESAREPRSSSALEVGPRHEPPAPQVLVPIELPFAPGSVVLETARDISSVVLFAEEVAPIRRRVGEFLAGQGHRLVPLEQLALIEADAVAGRLRLEGGQVCRAGLSRAEVWARYFAAWPRATITAQCIDDCMLHVDVNDPADEGGSWSYASRPVRRPHDPRAWAKASLREVDGGMGFIVGGFGSSHPPPIMFGQIMSIGPWTAKPGGDRLTALEPAVARCAHPDPHVGLSYDVRAAVGADGTITRCSARSEHASMRPRDAACLCEGIETLRYPRGRAGRRFRVVAQDTGGRLSTHVALEPRQPGTEVWIERLQGSPALASCVAQSRPTDGFVATAVLRLATDGMVEGVELLGDITTMPSMRFAQCLVGELKSVPLPCRPPGIDTLQVEVSVGASRRRPR